jgi:hypothetical protein
MIGPSVSTEASGRFGVYSDHSPTRASMSSLRRKRTFRIGSVAYFAGRC